MEPEKNAHRKNAVAHAHNKRTEITPYTVGGKLRVSVVHISDFFKVLVERTTLELFMRLVDSGARMRSSDVKVCGR